LTGAARVGFAGPGAVLIAAAVWGTSGTAAALLPQVSPLTVGSLTLAVSGVVLAATAARGVGGLLRQRSAWPLLIVSAGALAIYILAFFAGMALAGVALGTVVAIASSPLFVQAIETAVGRSWPAPRWLVAAVVTLIGVVLLVGGRVGEDGPGSSLVGGVSLALIAGLAYAVFTVGTARLLRRADVHGVGVPDRAVIGAVQLLTVVPLLVVAIIAGVPKVDDVAAWGVLLYIGLVPTAVGYLLYTRGLARVSAATAALLTLLEPVVAAVLAAVLLDQRLSVVGWTGIVVTLLGLALAALPAQRRAATIR